MKIRCVLVLILLTSLSACQHASLQDSTGWYEDRDAVAPRKDRVVICHGFGCQHRTPVSITSQTIQSLKNILAKGAGSPEKERQSVRKAVMWFEKHIAPLAGSAHDIGGLDMHNAGKRGQMDCIDEATNTTSLLWILDKHGLLKYHHVGMPVARGFFLDGRYPHATATLIETESNIAYAIDPWPYGNAENVDIMLLSVWMTKRGSL